MLHDLNDEQRAAVLEEGNVLVTACPGSGKTRVLATKVAYELGKMQSTKKFVVALTYTNRAADEIQTRLDKYLLDTTQLWAGTIHSFCLEWIVRPFASYHDRLKNGFAVADEYLTTEILDLYKSLEGVPFYKNIVTKHNRSGVYFNETEKAQLVADLYHQYLSENKLIDFDMILYISYQLLTGRPAIARSLSKIVSVICVDEYQDTQDMQYGIIGEIMKEGNGIVKLFMVGDSDQAIYDSLGGQAKSIDEIEEEIGGVEVKKLELSGNYRSTQRIIELYRNFQMSNIDIVAIGRRANVAGNITFDDQVHKDELAQKISRLIKASLKAGIPEEQICVLAPRWRLVTPMGRTLRRLMPDVNFDAPGLSPLHRQRENIWFKISRLLLTEPSPRLYMARLRWSSEVIREFKEQYSITIASQYQSSKGFLKLINSICCKAVDGIEYLKEAFQYIKVALGLDVGDSHLLMNQLENFIEGAKKIQMDGDFLVPTDIESMKGWFKERKGIVINTCHAVKGEEFETVIAFGLLRNIIPHWSVIDWNDPTVEVPSSKRLLYVICSRAKSNLHLIAEKGRLSQSKKPYPVNFQLGDVEFAYDNLELLDT